MNLTLDALQDLPLGYQVTGDDVAALSGQNRVKGIHPLLHRSPASVIILCTLKGGDYPDRWLDSDHSALMYCLEGREDAQLKRKLYNKEIKTNRAVAGATADGHHVHVFWRTEKRIPFRYAGRYVFDGFVTQGDDEAFRLVRLGLPEAMKQAVQQVAERELENAMEAMTEESFATWIESVDGTGSVAVREGLKRVRKLNRKVVEELKAQYGGRCQVCGYSALSEYGVDISEGHHIDHFAKSFDNRPQNIAILCPTHHRLVHAMEATLDRGTKAFVSPTGQRLPLTVNLHL